MLKMMKIAQSLLGLGLAAGSLSIAPTVAHASAALVRYTSAGALDNSLGGDGKLVFSVPGLSSTTAVATALDSTGRIVVAGNARLGGETRVLVARFLPNGALDSSFDADGYAITNFPSANDEVAEDLAIDAAGRIVVAGHAGGQFALARYNPNGSLDPSFNDGGRVLTPFISMESAEGWSLAIGSNGRIVVAGRARSGLQSFFALARYNPDGSLDASFNGDGRVLTQFPGRSSAEAFDVAIDSNGRTVAVGSTRLETDEAMAIARYTTTGALDVTYGAGGRVEIDFLPASAESARSVLIDANNRVVVGGYADDEFALARTLPNGAPDPTFDGDGKVTTDFANQELEAINDLVFMGPRIVAIGWARGNQGYHFAGARYLTNGALDATFDVDGKVWTDFDDTNLDRAWAAAIDANGRIVAVGESGQAVP